MTSPLRERSRTRSQVWRFTRNRTHLYRAIVTLRNDDGGRAFVRRDTDLVVDGFERSGNTFATTAVLDANPHIAVAHHTHSPTQFIWATRWGVPAMLVVRDPGEVAVSVHLRWPSRTLDEILEDHIAFHRRVTPLRPRLVVAPFGRVRHDLGGLLDEVNQRFGRRFAPFAHTPDDEARVFAAIEERNRRRYGTVTEVAVARPSAARADAGAMVRVRLAAPGTAERLAEARGVVRDLLGADAA